MDFCFGGIIGPYFVDSEHYRSMINNFFWLEVECLDTNDI